MCIHYNISSTKIKYFQINRYIYGIYRSIYTKSEIILQDYSDLVYTISHIISGQNISSDTTYLTDTRSPAAPLPPPSPSAH